MARGRGIVLSGSQILSLKGERIATFYGCDEEYLALDGIAPGDFVTFGREGSLGHAINIRKTTATPKEVAKHSATIADVAKQIAERNANVAATKKATTKKAAKKPETHHVEIVEPIFRTLLDLGFLPSKASLTGTTKAITDDGLLPPRDELATTILEHNDSPRFLRYSYKEDSHFAARLNALLEGTPIRVFQVAASLKKGHEIELRTPAGNVVERAWFSTADEIVQRVSQELAARKSPRTLWVLNTFALSTTLIIATADEAEAIDSK